MKIQNLFLKRTQRIKKELAILSPIYNHWKSSINSYVLFFLRKKTSYTDEEYFYRDFICNMRFLSFLNNLYSIFYNSFYLHFLLLFSLKHRCFQYGSIRADWCRNIGTYRPFWADFRLFSETYLSAHFALIQSATLTLLVVGNISSSSCCFYMSAAHEPPSPQAGTSLLGNWSS